MRDISKGLVPGNDTTDDSVATGLSCYAMLTIVYRETLRDHPATRYLATKQL